MHSGTHEAVHSQQHIKALEAVLVVDMMRQARSSGDVDLQIGARGCG